MSTTEEMVLVDNLIGDAIVLEAQGNINSSNAKQFGEHMNGLIEAGCRHLVIDLSKLVFMTSAGFRALLVAGKSAAKSNGTLALCGVNENISRLFELGGFLDLFPMHPDRETALSNLN